MHYRDGDDVFEALEEDGGIAPALVTPPPPLPAAFRSPLSPGAGVGDVEMVSVSLRWKLGVPGLRGGEKASKERTEFTEEQRTLI
eukprot:764709-Hanusia_phi.AAC.3